MILRTHLIPNENGMPCIGSVPPSTDPHASDASAKHLRCKSEADCIQTGGKEGHDFAQPYDTNGNSNICQIF